MLDRYERAVSSLRAGLVDLEGSPSYLMLSGDELGPITRARVGRSAPDPGGLWTRLQTVEAAVHHIAEYIETNGVRGVHRAEVERLLGQRWLEVGSPSRLRAISEVLAEVRATYDEIRPLVTEVEELWLAILPRLDAAKVTLGRLDAEVDRLGVPEPLIGRASASVADLGQRLVADPLSVTAADGDELDTQVAAAAGQVASMLAGHDALDDDLAGTAELLASLRVLRARAQASGSQAEAKVLGVESLVRVPSAAVLDGPGGLAEGLDRLFDSGDVAWNQRRGLLDGWLSTARKLERQLQAANEANSGPIRRRDELRGRLQAYRAKISAVGRAEDLDLTALVDDARSQLYTAPADLDRAAVTIDELARMLRS